MKLKVAEMFAGVGGFRVGLNHIKGFDSDGKAIENGNWDFVWANQWEPSTKAQYAYECYTTRFGVKNHSNEDIHLVDKKSIPDHNLLVGGFPCQDYSVARSLSKEKGIEGKKGVLFWDIKDVIVAKQPAFVLLENVDRLLKSPASQRGRDFAIMLKTFADLGYMVQWRVINAADYGMPQKRRRVFIFATKDTTNYYNNHKDMFHEQNYSLLLQEMHFFNNVFPVENVDEKVIHAIDMNEYKDVLNISEEYHSGKFLTSGLMIDGKIIHFEPVPITEDIYPLAKVVDIASKIQQDREIYLIPEDKLEKWKYLKGSKKIERVKPNGEKYYYSEGNMNFPDDLKQPGRTMLTSESSINRSSHIIFDDKYKAYRTITEIEAELLQMFPANWTNSGMPKRNRYFMMGNALVTGIISRLEPELRNILEQE